MAVIRRKKSPLAEELCAFLPWIIIFALFICQPERVLDGYGSLTLLVPVVVAHLSG